MRRRPKSHERPARGDVALDRLELGVGQGSESDEHHDEVRVREHFEAGDVREGVGIDQAVAVETVEDGRADVVIAAEQGGEPRKRFLAAVFLVTRDEDHVRPIVVLRRRRPGGWRIGVEDRGPDQEESRRCHR